MVKINQVILVDNDCDSNLCNEKIIKESSLSSEVKITLNGGHALLYLDHINHKLDKDFKVLILLNMETPIADGFDFLQGYYKESKKIKNKENILIVVLSNNLSNEKMERIQRIGQVNFISSPISMEVLNTLVQKHFSLPVAPVGSEPEFIMSNDIVSNPEKKEKPKRKSRKSQVSQGGLRVA
jgi:response regulator RpfG family c-di-GMP phosphodiesterase